MIGKWRWTLGIVLLGALGWQTSAGAQPVSLPPLETGVSVDLARQDQVSDALVILCEGYRCEGYRRDVRIPIRQGDTLDSLQNRLVDAMRAEVNRVFTATTPVPERVIVTGYVFNGGSAFVDREVPLFTMFVPRHRWLVGRYGIEQDGIYYDSLVASQLDELLTPAIGDEGTDVSGGDLDLPALPDLDQGGGENGGSEGESLPGQIERRPISP